MSSDGDVSVAVSNSAFMFPFLQRLRGTSAPPHRTNSAFFSPAACCHIVLALSPLAVWKSRSEVAFQLSNFFGFLFLSFLKSGAIYVTQPQLFYTPLSRHLLLFEQAGWICSQVLMRNRCRNSLKEARLDVKPQV